MGFDLIGVNPSSEKGEYFRNNISWWGPLWQYIGHVAPDIITQEDVENGCWNDGHLIDAAKAEKLATRLNFLIENENVAQFEKERNEFLESLPDETCNVCHGTGKKKWENKELQECYMCGGKGIRRPFAAQRPFSEENVKQFIEFCSASGGFKIW